MIRIAHRFYSIILVYCVTPFVIFNSIEAEKIYWLLFSIITFMCAIFYGFKVLKAIFIEDAVGRRFICVVMLVMLINASIVILFNYNYFYSYQKLVYIGGLFITYYVSFVYAKKIYGTYKNIIDEKFEIKS